MSYANKTTREKVPNEPDEQAIIRTIEQAHNNFSYVAIVIQLIEESSKGKVNRS